MAIKLVNITGDLLGATGTTSGVSDSAPTSATLEIVPSKPFSVLDDTLGASFRHTVLSEGRLVKIASPANGDGSATLFKIAPTAGPTASPSDASYLVKIKTVLNDPGGSSDTRQVKISYERWTIPDVTSLRFGDITRVTEPTTATVGDFIRKTGDSASGIISFVKGLNINAGEKLFLDGGSSVAFMYDSASQEVRLMIGATVIAAWKA